MVGCRGEATRLGSKESGLTVEANGWNGVRVWMFHDAETGYNVARIHITGGSRNPARVEFVGEFTDEQVRGETCDGR